MDPDNLQEAWQSPASHSRLTIDADVLLNEVRQSQRVFAGVIFWRDFREIGVAVILVPVWICIGWAAGLPWSWYLTVPSLIGVAGFLLIDRLRHGGQAPAADQPLRVHVEFSLTAVEHQIWLLRNIFWWYILPFLVPALAFLTQLAWLSRDRGFNAQHMMVLVGIVVLATMYFIYWLNQRAVRTNLQPRRDELKAILASLADGP